MDIDSTITRKFGMSPGSLIHIGDIHETTPLITVTHYNKHQYKNYEATEITDIFKDKPEDSITWVNVAGLKNVDFIESIGQYFNIHSLVLEDILHTNQRSKLEEFDEYIYIVMKSITCQVDEMTHEQISFLMLKDFVFTFTEQRSDLFKSVDKRLQNKKSRLRCFESDYLTYVLMDILVDQHFILQDALDDLIDGIEDEILSHPNDSLLGKVQKIKRDLIYIRRTISPMREMLSGILRSDSSLISEKTIVYFKDVYDHVLRVAETIELQRDMVYSLMDMYQTHMSNKMNEIMKVLTVFSVIFIPLTFLAGIYGMNFEYIPELKWKYGYLVLWIIFFIIASGLLYLFKKKKWI